VPAKFAGLLVPGILENNTVSLCGVINTPRTVRLLAMRLKNEEGDNLLDLVCGVSRVIDHTMDLLSGLCIHISQEPVAQYVRLHSPGEFQVAITGLDVDKACLWLADGTLSILNSESLFSFFLL
jgi:hypothetical protein